MERDNYSRNELIAGLKKAAQGNSRNKTARLREIFDEVEAAKDSGLSLKSIVAVLAERGLVFDLPTFVNTRHRIKKERLKEPTDVPAPNSLAQITTYSNSPKKEQARTISNDLIRPQGITDSAWLDMKVQHFTNMRRN